MAEGGKGVKFAAGASDGGGGAPKPKRTKRDTIINLAEFAGLKPKAKPQFTQDQIGRGATFNVSDFDPDEAGEGALTDFERNIYNKLRPIARENGTPRRNPPRLRPRLRPLPQPSFFFPPLTLTAVRYNPHPPPPFALAPFTSPP